VFGELLVVVDEEEFVCFAVVAADRENPLMGGPWRDFEGVYFLEAV